MSWVPWLLLSVENWGPVVIIASHGLLLLVHIPLLVARGHLFIKELAAHFVPEALPRPLLPILGAQVLSQLHQKAVFVSRGAETKLAKG